MHDSITSLALRQLRRIWPWIVVIAVLGGVFGAVLADRRSQAEITQTVRISRTADVANLLQIGAIPNIDVRQIATQVSAEYETTDLAEQVAVRTTPDPIADIITLVATGEEDAAVEALELFTAGISQRAAEPRIVEIDKSIASTEATIAQTEERIAQLESTLQEFAPDESGRDAVLINLVAFRSSLLQYESRLEGLLTYREFVTDSLTEAGAKEIRSGGSASPTSVVAGALVATIVAVGGVFVFAALDRRIRRRLHLLRAAPDVPVVAVLPRRRGEQLFDEVVVEGIRRSVLVPGTELVAVVGLGRPALEGVVSQSFPGEGTGGVRVVATDGELPAPSALPPEVTTVVLVIRFGELSEEHLGSVVNVLRAAGYRSIVSVLSDVPDRDLDWASVGPEHTSERASHAS